MVTLFPKNKMATVKIKTQGFKTTVYKPMGDVTTATSIIYTVYDTTPLKCFRTCRCRSRRKPWQCEMWSFPRALLLPRVFLSRGHVTAHPRRRAAESNCIDNNAQEHARTITHAFVHTLMYLSMHESKHALFAHTASYVQTKPYACTRKKQHIERDARTPSVYLSRLFH